MQFAGLYLLELLQLIFILHQPFLLDGTDNVLTLRQNAFLAQVSDV